MSKSDEQTKTMSAVSLRRSFSPLIAEMLRQIKAFFLRVSTVDGGVMMVQLPRQL